MRKNSKENTHMFKKMVTKLGKISFFRDSKSILPEDVPPEVHVLLAGNESKEVGYKEENVDKKEAAPEEDKYEGPVSAISGAPAARQRFLNGQVYWVTEEEYKISLGNMAEGIRNAQTVVKDKK